MNKEKRQKLIIKILNEHAVTNQNELLVKMQKEGCAATQATVSRDIKELKIIKETDKFGRSKYILNDLATFIKVDDGINNIFSDVILNVGVVKNIVIIKCKNATASAACIEIDRLNYEGVAGTVAGYNTIMVVMENDEKAIILKKDIENRM